MSENKTKNAFRNRASFGKRIEYNFISKLLLAGVDVYTPLVDDDGIDAIIKIEIGEIEKFIKIQVKARSIDGIDDKYKEQNSAFFPAIKHDKIRSDYWFIFYSEYLDKAWMLSSSEFIEESDLVKSGEHKGLRGIRFSRKNNKKAIPNEKYDKYLIDDNYDFLRLKKFYGLYKED